MARYKTVDRSPRFLPIVLDAQLMVGSFEYALDYLIDNEVDLSGVANRYCNDETGAPAYDPAVTCGTTSAWTASPCAPSRR